jgi:exopolysaccharide biosynthesis protein
VGVEAGPLDVWQEVSLDAGLTYRHLSSRDGPWGVQTVDVLVVDPAVRELAPIPHDGCETVSEVLEEHSALVGINAGFFDGACNSEDMVRWDGVTYSTNTLSSTQPTFVWDDGEAPEIVWLDAGEDHNAHQNGLGSYPSLVVGGAVDIAPDTGSSFFVDENPRTAVGVDAAGRVLLVSVDGRSETADGFTMVELANAMIDLGAVEALNLDGGGSTTAVVPGCSVNGVVNHPSDGGGEDHEGSRSVADGLYVF